MKTNKLTLTAALVFALALSPTAFAQNPVGCIASGGNAEECLGLDVGDNGSGIDQDTLDEIAASIEQLNNEDMRVKSGTLNGNQLTLRVEDMAKSRGRDTIYGKDVVVDLSGLDQSAEIGSQGDSIVNNTTNIEGNTQNITNNRTDINKQGDRITVNEGDIEGLGDRVTVNEGDINSQGDTLNEHDTRISANEQAINEFNNFGPGSYRADIDANEYGINQNRLAINQLERDMRSLDRNLSAGIASAVAMSQHQFNPSYNGGQVSLAGGTYNGQTAFSLAFGAPISDVGFFNWSISGNSGSGKHNTAFGVGGTFYLPK